MATSSNPPLNETNTEPQPHSPPEKISAEAFKALLNNDPIPNFDINTIRPAVPEVKIDVAQRVEELHKYLRENKFRAHWKNIMAAIEMYNRKELPIPGIHAVAIQDGKLLTEVTVDCLLRTEPVWTEGYFFQYMQAHGHQPQPQSQSAVFGYNGFLGGAEIVMRILLPPNYGGHGPPVVVQALNDTGSDIMTLFYHEAINMGWQPNVFPATLVQINSADGATLQESIWVFAQVCDYNGSPLTGWFAERVVLRNFTGTEVRLSGSNVRNQLYIGTAPRLQNLYMARTKTHLSRILPNLSQLP